MTLQTVNCPTCGSSAERRYFHTNNRVRTQCDVCDYLLETCQLTGRVLNTHTASFSVS